MRTPETDVSAGACDPWTSAMRGGEWEDAWRMADGVLRSRIGKPCWHWPRHEQYVWQGQSLAGQRVLVRCYHGLGDTVQFIRYMAPLQAIAREVIVWAQPALLPLLSTVAGIDQLLPLNDGTPEVAYDVDVELMELPHVFRTTLATVPRAVPYVFPRRLAVAGTGSGASSAEEPGVGRKRRVGIVWQSGGWDERRSIPTALIPMLTGVAGVELIALQQGAGLAQWRAEWGTVASTDDVMELARRMLMLDLVISVDSFPAHLAGTLAVPTWVLLHADPDWRWMTARHDSPWYPTMHLFRQSTAGEWKPVVRRVAEALGRFAWTQGTGNRRQAT